MANLKGAGTPKGNSTPADAVGDTAGISPAPTLTPLLPKKPAPRRLTKRTRSEFEAYRDSHAVAAATPGLEVQCHAASAATKENISPTSTTPQTGEKRTIQACMEEEA